MYSFYSIFILNTIISPFSYMYRITLVFFMAQIALNAQHIVPESIEEEARIALSHYPELAKTPITFKFKKNIKKIDHAGAAAIR